jgi:small basic protein (TIGR04137 family)
MSIHNSLKLSKSGGGQRNVWTRVERIVALKKAGRWEEKDGVEGLPKVRTSFKIKAKPKAKAAEGEGADAAKPAAGAAAKPAAAKAAPAKPAAKK